jgi:hypothetical protein
MTMPSIRPIFIVSEKLFRGVKGLDQSALRRLVGSDDAEGVVDLSKPVSSKDHPWWTSRPGLAMVYAGTKNVSGKGDVGSDLMLLSSQNIETKGTGGIVDLSKSTPVPIVVDKAAWVPSSLPFEEKKAKLFKLLGIT